MMFRYYEKTRLKIKNYNNSFNLLTGVFFFKLLMLIMTFAIAKLLDVGEFGEYSIFKASATTLTSVFVYFLNLTIVKSIAENKHLTEIKLARGVTIFIGIVMVLLIYVFNEYFITYIFKSKMSDLNMFFVLLIFFFSLLSGSETGILIGLEKAKFLGKINLFSFLTIPFVLILTYYMGVNGALAGLFMVYFIQSMSLIYFVNKAILLVSHNDRQLKYSNSILKQKLYTYLKRGIPLLLITFLTSVPFFIAKLFLFNSISSNALALFELAYQWYMIAITITSSLIMGLLPTIVNFDGDKKIISKYLIGQRKILMIVVLFLFMVCVLSSFIIESYIYVNYTGLTKIVFILALSILPCSLFLLEEKILIASGKLWILLSCHFIYLLFFLSFLFLSQFSVFSLSYSLFFGYTFSFLFIYIINRKIMLNGR